MSRGHQKTPLPGLELTKDVLFSTDAASRQAQRRENGLDLAAALLDGPLEWFQTDDGPAIVNLDTGELVEDRSAAFAALLAFAADESNQVSGVLDDGHGGTFHAGAALWKPSLRLDPNWMETVRRRARTRAHEAMRRLMDGLTMDEKAARQYGWKQRATLKLLTLTMPHHAATSSVDEVKRLNLALSLLKKRAWWKGLVLGGIKGVEDALDADGPHVHAHLLILSRFMRREDLLSEWRACLEVATWKTYGFGLAEDCPLIVDIRQVRRKGTKPGAAAIGWEDALNETTKYVTKPADFLKRDDQGRRVSREVLLDICEVRRWPRMFELLGRCREALKASTRHGWARAAQAALDSIHRAYSTGELPKLPKEVGWEQVEGWDLELDGPEEKRKLIILALKARDRDGPGRIRPPSWRDLLDILPLSEWLSVMAERFRRGKQFRIQQLLDMNPNAYLMNLRGQVFGTEPTR